MRRRTYLQVVGASAVSAAAASPAAATEHTGYGAEGYGTSPYGGSSDSDDGGDGDDGDGGDGDTGDEIGDPVIDHLALSDVSPPHPHVDLVIDWAVSHPDGELSSAELAIRTSTGSHVETLLLTASGSRASGTEETSIKHGAGETYDVTLTVTDTAGNTASEMESLETSR